MIKKQNRNIRWLALTIMFIAVVSAYSLIISYRSEVNSHRRVLLGRGQTVLDSLKAGILIHGRMGRYRGDRLTIIFEELASNPNILALALRNPDGVSIASGGKANEIPETLPNQPVWNDDRLIITSHVDLLSQCSPRGAGYGRQGWENSEDWPSFEEGLYTLTAVLDATDAHLAIQRHRVQFAVSAGLISLALGLGAYAIILLLKRAEMTALLEGERERARRQEQIALLGAGLAHETKNPLGIVRGLAQSMGECSHEDCPIKDHVQHIVDEVDKVIGGINSFLALARPQEAVPVPVALDHFFESFLPLVQMDASAAEVEIVYTPCNLRILADEELLRRAILNLLLNALHASKSGQQVSIIAERANVTLALHISDTGCGIAPEDLPRVTEPYFTRFSGGSGLGLPIVAQIAAAHGWQLQITSEPGQGARATLAQINIVESS